MTEIIEMTEGSITLLFQRSSQPGLELLSPQEEWSPVPVRPFGTEVRHIASKLILVSLHQELHSTI